MSTAIIPFHHSLTFPRSAGTMVDFFRDMKVNQRIRLAIAKRFSIPVITDKQAPHNKSNRERLIEGSIQKMV